MAILFFYLQKHFTDDQWEKVRVDGKRKLRSTAIPTIFPHTALKAKRRKLTLHQQHSTSENECSDPSVETVAELQQQCEEVQSGVRLSTQSVLDLQALFLLDNNYKFLLTARFTQDCLENLFSCVRSIQKVPTALQFKQNLKTICVAQYFTDVGKGSYDKSSVILFTWQVFWTKIQLNHLLFSLCLRFQKTGMNMS